MKKYRLKEHFGRYGEGSVFDVGTTLSDPIFTLHVVDTLDLIFPQFEELPESQEEKDHGKCSASFCRAGGGYENCTHPDNDFEKARRNKPQKEECKGGGHKFLDGEGICICGSVARQKPQPKQKPSEWIKNRARELAISATGYVTNQADYLNVATRDFLDSHADIFNK